MKEYFYSSFILVMILFSGCYQSPQRSEVDSIKKEWDRVVRDLKERKRTHIVTSMAEFVEDLPLYAIRPGMNLVDISTRLSVELNDNLVKDKALNQLKRFFDKDFGYDAKLWEDWIQENKNYLYFSEKENYFLVDEEAKTAGIPTEEYRKTHPWPTETDKPKEPDKPNENNK